MQNSVGAFEQAAERNGDYSPSRLILQGRATQAICVLQSTTTTRIALQGSALFKIGPSLSNRVRTLVVVATYNEIENLPRLVDEIFQLAADVHLLVIDDNSPDGTGNWCDEHMQQEPRLACLHRTGKLGLGSATIAGFQYAIERQYEFVVTMDADFSHHPKHLPALRAGVEPEEAEFDVMIGSRYVAGGGVAGWPLHRRIMSRAINTYARWLLRLRVNDCSGAFRCYRVSKLRELDFGKIRSTGYSYLEEILWLLNRQRARFGETPITFIDRELGQTKINMREALLAVLLILRLGLRQWFGL